MPAAALLGCIFVLAFTLGMLSRARGRGLCSVTCVVAENSFAWWTLVLGVLLLHGHLVPVVASAYGKAGLMYCLCTLASFAGTMGTCHGSAPALHGSVSVAQAVGGLLHSFFSLLTFALAPVELLLVKWPPYKHVLMVSLCSFGLIHNSFKGGTDLTVFAAYEICFIMWYSSGVLSITV